MEKAMAVAGALADSNIMMEDTWIGGRRLDFTWSWIDNEAVSWRKNEIPMESDTENFPPWSREPSRPTKECLSIDRRSHSHPNFIDLDCRLQRPFICEKKPEASLKNPVPSKWVQIHKSIYTLYHGRLTWPEAAAFCRSQGARLAIVNNRSTIDILTSSMTKTRPDFEAVWIGAHFSYGQWMWISTGMILSPVMGENGYPPWQFGRSEKKKGCLLLDRHIEASVHFVEIACDRKRDFVCEEYSEDEEDDWRNEPAKFSHDNTTYIIYPADKTWEDGRNFCEERGSILASLDNMNATNLIVEAMGDHPREISHVWLGGHYNRKYKRWQWLNNEEKISTEKDTEGFPPWANIDAMEDYFPGTSICLNMDRSDHVKPHIYGLDCESKQPFVCKIKSLAQDNAQTIASSVITEVVTESSQNNRNEFSNTLLAENTTIVEMSENQAVNKSQQTLQDETQRTDVEKKSKENVSSQTEAVTETLQDKSPTEQITSAITEQITSAITEQISEMSTKLPPVTEEIQHEYPKDSKVTPTDAPITENSTSHTKTPETTLEALSDKS
ncbi:C-type mannose receptor 2 [Orussus abietinus]|uniref:C-type mannose receptor 2 n=1 Tax=Orussus abietinus TaxID=222816 RepID=UPI0006256D0E|nr:C-type mannose receptor 2 [Orussus abietinus]XP_012274353.1 C-type mannose receptor 2 [Orussus abietinus]